MAFGGSAKPPGGATKVGRRRSVSPYGAFVAQKNGHPTEDRMAISPW